MPSDPSTPNPKWYVALYSRVHQIRRHFGLVALFFAIAANLATIPGHIGTVKIYLLERFAIEDAVFWHLFSAFVVSFVLLISYGFLALWLARRAVGIRNNLLIGVAALLLFLANIYIAIPPRPNLQPVIKDVRNDMLNSLLGQQDDKDLGEDGGGFRFALTDGPHDTQVWTTAQVLYALETIPSASIPASSRVSEAIRQGLEFIERMRVQKLQKSHSSCEQADGQQDGWAYIKSLPWGVTEVNSWVLLSKVASFRSLSPSEMWDQSERASELQGAKLDAAALARRQHGDGGWGPIAKTDDANHLRTYSTLMAVWSLLQARQSASLGPMLGASYDLVIRDGSRWLLRNWSEKQGGWSPNPAWKEEDKFYPGLTAEALYVLVLVSESDYSIAKDDNLRNAKESFMKWATGKGSTTDSFDKRDISKNDSAHDSDRYLENEPYTVEQSTFLWYPWTIAVLSEIARAKATPTEMRKEAKELLKVALGRISGYAKFTTMEPVAYPLAEGLIGLNIADQSME